MYKRQVLGLTTALLISGAVVTETVFGLPGVGSLVAVSYTHLDVYKSQVLRSLLNRLVGLVAVMFIVATIVFVIIRVTPGNPAAVMLGPQASQADIAALEHQLGLDLSLIHILYK